jgi:hypothetical protein
MDGNECCFGTSWHKCCADCTLGFKLRFMLTQNGAGTVCMYVFLYNGGGTVMYVFMYVYTFGTWKINGGGYTRDWNKTKELRMYVCMYVTMYINVQISLTMVRIPPSVGGESSPLGAYLR